MGNPTGDKKSMAESHKKKLPLENVNEIEEVVSKRPSNFFNLIRNLSLLISSMLC